MRTTPTARRRLLASAAVPALVAATLAVGAAPASAGFVAGADDPVGDAPRPDLDITSVAFGYDRREGLVVGALQLAAEPVEDLSFVTLVAATRTATGCDQGPAVGLGTSPARWAADWVRFGEGGEVAAQGTAVKRGGTGTVQRIEITDPLLRAVQPDCLMVTLTDGRDPNVIHDVVGPVTLARRPALSMRLSGLPSKVRPGRTYRLKVRLENPGDAATGPVRVVLSKVRGLSVKRRSVTVKSLAAGAARNATLQVRLTRSARTSTKLDVKATAGQMKVAGERRVTVVKPSSRKRGGGGGDKRVRTCVQYFPDLSGSTGGSLGLVPCLR